jgi:hypothetical protein
MTEQGVSASSRHVDHAKPPNGIAGGRLIAGDGRHRQRAQRPCLVTEEGEELTEVPQPLPGIR